MSGVCGRRWAMYTTQSRVPVQLRILHQRGRLWPQVECAEPEQVARGDYAIWWRATG